MITFWSFVCLTLALVVAVQCFIISIKMTATAKPYLKYLVGAGSFASVTLGAISLSSPEVPIIGVCTLVVMASAFGRVLRKWRDGMPAQHDTNHAPLGDQ